MSVNGSKGSFGRNTSELGGLAEVDGTLDELVLLAGVVEGMDDDGRRERRAIRLSLA